MLGKLYIRLNHVNPMVLTQARNFAHVPRAIGPNDGDVVRKLKNKKLAKYGRVQRYWDNYSTAERPMPAGVYKEGVFQTNFNNYSQKEMQRARLEACKHMFGRSLYDTGSAAMQAAALCEKTISLVKHMKDNHKDSNAARHLNTVLARRRTALEYLKRKDFQRYSHLIFHYGVKDVVTGLHKEHFGRRRAMHLKNVRR